MTQEALFEHRFWLQILGDHSRFIYNALSPKEVKDVQTAAQYIRHFDQLLSISRMNDAQTRLPELNKQALEATMSLRAYKLDLLDRLLLGQVSVGLTPTFINHMVNELDEYKKIVTGIIRRKTCTPLRFSAS